MPKQNLNDYVANVTRPKFILNDSGTQFASQICKSKLADMKVDVMFSPIRHPQAKPSERCTRAIGKFCLSNAMRHIKDGKNYYRTFKAGSMESCQIQLATALLS